MLDVEAKKITHKDFQNLLVRCKLVRQERSSQDERWVRFYSKFKDVIGDNPQVLTAVLFFLTLSASQSTAEAQQRHVVEAIGNLFTDKTSSGAMLSSSDTKFIVQTIVRLCLILLPQYANDFPSTDKRAMNAFLF